MLTGSNVPDANGAAGESVHHRLDEVLQRFLAVDGVVGCVIATRDGALVASAVEDEHTAQTLAATTAAICGRLNEVSERLGLGGVNAVLTDTATHTLQFMPLGSAMLAVIAKRHHNVRQVREMMRSIAVTLAGHPALLAPR